MRHLLLTAATACAAIAAAPLVALAQASPAPAMASAAPMPAGAAAPAGEGAPTGAGVVTGQVPVGATPLPTVPPDVTASTYVPTTYVEDDIPNLTGWNAFIAADKAANEYSMTVRTHVVFGGRTEERLYHMAYRKPLFGWNDIVSGNGAGQAAVWHGGNRVRGHNALGLKAVLPINDPKAMDLAGKTIVAAFFPWIINGFELAGGGKIYEQPGPTIGGEATTLETMIPLNPKADRGCTSEQLFLSTTTHLPVEHDCYAGGTHQEHEVFSDFKINPNLPDSTYII